ncbi:uncharacterized protein J3R85_010961 [Psidium guajava]|nr:uncharacterized protein J3R85_010961 [Psidium guajava]
MVVVPPANLVLLPLDSTGLKDELRRFNVSPLNRVFSPISNDEAIASIREAFSAS